VYIINNLGSSSKDNAVWDHLLSSFEEKVCMDLILGGMFFFEDSEEAENFYRVFNYRPAYASNIYAVLFDAAGRILTENTKRNIR
jgi:hypothetical protein